LHTHELYKEIGRKETRGYSKGGRQQHPTAPSKKIIKEGWKLHTTLETYQQQLDWRKSLVLWCMKSRPCVAFCFVSTGFGSGFGVYNGSVAALPSSSTGISSSPQYTFQLPGTGMKDSLIRSPSYNNYSHKVTKSKITPRQVSFDSKSIQSGGLARFHQAQSDSKDSPKEALSETTSSSSENHYPSAGNEKLYEAYNDLHSLAQDFQKPFDAPAIVVVGHQTDGKSALIEALMGFQFNHVGGGTKTRRPITLHMKYNALCSEPRCFLITEDMPPIEEEKRLEELQVLFPFLIPALVNCMHVRFFACTLLLDAGFCSLIVLGFTSYRLTFKLRICALNMKHASFGPRKSF